MNLSLQLSADTQAILLLTSHFSRTENNDVKPLTNSEWQWFSSSLKLKGASPANLLTSESSLIDFPPGSKLTDERIRQLLGRRHSLALAVEKWQRANLWVLTQTDKEFPRRVINRLNGKAAPVLYGCGEIDLLNTGGLAVIGSRNASTEDLSYSKMIGNKAANEKITIVSGGARGVDESCMLGAADAGGKVIGVLTDSLFKTAMSSKWRTGLMENRIALVSPFYPEAGFNVGNAMQRNKYIYCLAQSALVVHCGTKGGTLNGAKNNLKTKWVPLWVKPTNDRNAANEQLVQNGGHWVASDIEDLQVSDLIQQQSSPQDSSISSIAEQGVMNLGPPLTF